MRILVINLARATGRRDKMQKQLQSLGLDFEFIEATDGRLLTKESRTLVDNERRQSISPYPLSDNEIGCAISHRSAMLSLIEHNSEMIAILEDDVDLLADFPVVLRALETQHPEFDFIFLGRKFRKGEKFIPCHQLLSNLSLGRIGYTHMGAIGYIVSQKGAHKFLAYSPCIIHAIDKEIHRFWANGLDLYGLERPIIIHADGGHSYLEESRHQTQSELRSSYLNADRVYWRMRRRLTQASDSIHKRLAFPFYVRKAISYFSQISLQQISSESFSFSPTTKRLAQTIRVWPPCFRKIAESIYVLCRVAADRRIPLYCRIPALLGTGYFFNPIDIIPDGIPVFGYLDDIAVTALGVWVSVKLVSQDKIAQYRRIAQQLFETHLNPA